MWHVFVFKNWPKCELYALGKHDKLGIGYDVSPSINKVIGNFDVKQIECGSNHSILLTFSGHIYGCGNNSYGQLGLDNENYPIFNCIKFMADFITCGCNNSAFIDKGYLYVMGENYNNKLGRFFTNSIWEPTFVISNVKSVALGPTYSALIRDSDLFLSGNYKTYHNHLWQIIATNNNMTNVYATHKCLLIKIDNNLTTEIKDISNYAGEFIPLQVLTSQFRLRQYLDKSIYISNYNNRSVNYDNMDGYKIVPDSIGIADIIKAKYLILLWIHKQPNPQLPRLPKVVMINILRQIFGNNLIFNKGKLL